jgi:excisionase family DNA binding protein
MDEYISTNTAASMLGCTRQYIGELLRNGTLKGTKFEHQWIVDKNSVIEYKKKREKIKKSK